MQTVSSLFQQRAEADMRPIAWQVAMSFDKIFDDNIDIFTIGTSTIGGGDIIPGTGDVVQEWDKYQYVDYSDRVMHVEWVRQTQPYASVTTAMADITFDNHDDFFTPDGGSTIQDYILPARPIRIWAGFGDEIIPQFIGITDGMPVIDEKSKTATFHCLDYLYTLFDKPLTESVAFVDQRIDEILEVLFELSGLLAAQVNLDVSSTTIPYASWGKGSNILNALGKLMQAEGGRIFMDENGIIQFKNRQNYNDTVVYEFDAYTNIVDTQTRKEEDIINVVEITGGIREVQPLQPFGELSVAEIIEPGETKTIWLSFTDPVTSAEDPLYIDNATTSYFMVNTSPDGLGTASSSVTLTGSDLFADSIKLTFNNPTATLLYITKIVVFATPAVIVKKIYVREEDEASSEIFEERVMTIENDFFQNPTDAQSAALVILNDYSSFGGVNQLEVKGSMALQLDDTITVDVFGREATYKITKITNKISFPMKFTQLLTVRAFTATTYFTIESSLIGGDDQIRP